MKRKRVTVHGITTYVLPQSTELHICENPRKSSLRQQLHPLVMEGLTAFPTDKIDKGVPDPFDVPGKPVSDMVIEDRL